MEKDKKFNFFESYHKALSKVPDERYGRIVRKMSEFVFCDEEPSFDDAADSIVWELIKPILVRGIELSKARADAGKKGKGVSRNKGNHHAAKDSDKSKQNNTNQNGIGIGVGIGDKESTNVPKKTFSLPINARMDNFKNELEPYLHIYGKDLLNEFFSYWSEPDKKGNKMRFELEKTWDLKRRLSRWQNTGNNYGKSR